MRVASFTIRVVLLASILVACGTQTPQDTQGLVASLPDSITQTDSDQPDEDTPTVPTATKPTKPTKADDKPKVLAIAAMDPIAANKSYTLEPEIDAAETIEWTKISGPGTVTFSSKTTASTTVTATVEGHYVLGVTAKDASGKSVSATVSFDWDVTPPVVSTMASVLTGSSYLLAPTVSGATRIVWTKLFGSGNLTLSDPNAASTTVTASQDGNYVLRLTASDDAGNTTIKTVNFVWDTTPPAIGTVADVYTQASAYLEPNVSGATTYTWSKESGPGPITFSAPNAATTIATATVEGTYLLRLTARDTGGNTTTRDINFYRDTTPPGITAFADVYARQSKPVTTTVASATSYSWSKKSGPGSVSFSNPAALQTNVTALTEGLYVLTLKATDQAGNFATADVNFTWDTTAPSISAMTDIQTRVAASFSPTVTGAATYAWSKVSGPGTPTFTTPTTAATGVSATVDGTYLLRLSATDLAGNVATRDVNLIWDTTPPVITPMTAVASRSTITITPVVSGAATYAWSTVSGPGTLTYGTANALSTTVTATVDGTYVIQLLATDDVGNSSTATVNFTYDTDPPVVSTVADILTNTYVPVTPTVTGATRYAWTQKSGPGSVTFTAPFAQTSNVSASADGIYVITFTAQDAVGNSAARDINFTWDTTPPTAVLNNKPAVNTSSFTYNMTVTAVASDYTTYKYALIASVATCSGATYSAAVSSATALSGTISGEGTYIMCVLAGDAAGNFQLASSATQYSWTVDATPPSITLPASYDANAAKTVAATVTGASTYQWTKTTGTGTITFSAPTAASTSVTASAEGAYTLQLQATDLAGNVATATTTFTWDLTPPTIDPMAAFATNTGFTLNPTISGATTYAWSKTSGTGTVTFASPAAASTAVTISQSNVFVLRIVATDAAGNSSNQSVTVTYDTIAPVVAAVTAITTKAAVTITPTITETNPASYAWTMVSGPGTITFGTPSAASSTASASADGLYVLRLTVTDTAGNTGYRDINFTWDTTAPSITLNATYDARTTISVAPTVVGASTYQWTKVSGPGTITFSAATSATTNVSASAEGAYTLQLQATDVAGNVATATTTFTWDTTAPTVSAMAAINANASFTLAPTINGATSYVWSKTSGSGTVTFATPNAASTAVTISGDTTYVLRVVASDAAGNTATQSVTVYYDTVAPVVTLPATYNANAAKTVAATVTNATTYQWTQTAGPGTITFTSTTTASTSVTASAEGSYTLQFQASDAAGNVTTATTNFIWDVTAPTIDPITAFATNAGFTLSPNITGATTYAWTKVSGTGTVTFATPAAASTGVTISQSNVFVLRITATDAAGNSSNQSVTVTYDTVAPVVAAVTAINTKIAVTITPTITETYPASYAWTTISGPGTITFGTPSAASSTASASADGAYVLRLTVTDTAGNTGYRDISFTWDTTAPTITMPATTYARTGVVIAPTYGGATTYAWSKTAGTGTITFTSATSASPTVSSNTQGTFTLQVIASDTAGNQTTGTMTFVWDTTAPTVTITPSVTGASGPYTVTATFNETVSGLDINSTKISIGKGTLTALSPSSSATPTTSYTFSITPNGTPTTFQLLASAVTDLAGNANANSTTSSLVYDTSAPVAPESGAPAASVAVDGIGYNSAVVKWWWASDTQTTQTALKYYISYSTSSSFDTASQVLAGTSTAAIAQSSFATLYGCYTTPTSGTSQQCSYHLTGLQANTTYYANVVVEDSVGNQSVYTKGTFTTLSLQPVFKKIDASISGNTACGLAESGLVYCWGDNSVGAAGDGTQVSKNIPTAIDSSYKFVDISVGTNHACAIRDNGNAYCWGAGADGQLGNAANSMVLSPGLVGAATDVFTALVAGDRFTCAIRDDGKASCWGRNANGELGNNTTTSANTPTLTNGSNLYRKISAGANNVCAIKDDGYAYCWGLNGNGQLGNNTTTTKLIATQASGTTKFRDIAAGSASTCGIAGNGDLYCWGAGTSGQIGNGASADVLIPSKISGTDKFVGVAVSTSSACAIKDDGTLKCFGSNTNGELNTAGAQASSNTAVSSTDTNRYVSLVGGNSSFCGTQSSGTSYCWGLGTSGQLGGGDSTSRNSSNAITMTNVTTPTLVKFKKVVVGDVTTCGISTTQDLWCWGGNGGGATSYGELGIGAKIQMFTAPLHVGSLKWTDLSIAYNHVCGITDSYEAYCWGLNSSYELGIASGDTTTRYSPTKVSGTRKYLSIATASKSSCAASTDGQLVCWGSDAGSSSGNLASGAYAALQVPTASTDITNQYMKLTGGDTFFCGLTVDGIPRCWGRNSSGQLGTGNTTTVTTPTASTFDSANKFLAISAGLTHACGVTSAMTVRCAGLGSSGQMGNNTTTATNSTVTTPSWSTTKKVLPISWGGAITDHSCVTTSDYYSYCWGANASKQTNNSSTTSITTPQMQYSNIISTAAGTTVSCQLSSQGDISCFGLCDKGRCGQATPGTTDAQTVSGTALAVKVSGI